MARIGFAIVYRTEYNTTEVVFYQNDRLAFAFLQLLMNKNLKAHMFPKMEMPG